MIAGPEGLQARTSTSIRETILSQIRQIAQEQDKNLAPLTDDLVLLESGLILSASLFL